MAQHNTPNGDGSPNFEKIGADNPNAEKLEALRRRKQAERDANDILVRERHRRERTDGFTDNPFFWFFGARFFIGIFLLGAWILLSSLLWLFENLRWPMFQFLRAADLITGAAALPGAPFIIWTIWGALFGACLGNWLIAPVYGQRENRPLMLGLPLLLMIVSGLIFWAFLR